MFDQASLDKNIFVWWSRFLVAMCIIKFRSFIDSFKSKFMKRHSDILKGALNLLLSYIFPKPGLAQTMTRRAISANIVRNRRTVVREEKRTAGGRP